MKRMKLLFTLAIPVMLCQNALAQTSSRLTAASHWTSNGLVFKQMDSTSHMYGSEARGGDLKHTLKYDNSAMWVYANDSAYVNSSYVTQEFDINNNVTSMTYQYWSGTAWVLSTRTVYTYNSHNDVTSKIEQYWGGTSWMPSTKNVLSYDANNMVQLDQYQIWNSLTMAFETYSTKTYTYDATTKKLLNETGQYVYGGTPTYTEQYVYTYTSKNQLLSTTYSTWSLGWVNSTMYTNAYDTSSNLISTLYQTYDGTTSAWVNMTYSLFSNFTASHMAQTQVDQSWNTTGAGSWVNTMQYTHTYNSKDQLTSSTGQSWNVIGIFQYASGDPMNRFYYANYGTISAVKNVISNNGTAKMYPVPANNMLHIELNWNNAQASTIAIYDMTGRIVTPVINVPSATEYHTALPVSTLAAGTYVVKINGAEGQIVKQIVVAD